MEGFKNFMVYLGLSILFISGVGQYLFIQSQLEALLLLGEESYISDPIVMSGAIVENLNQIQGHEVIFQLIKNTDKNVIIIDPSGNEVKRIGAISDFEGFSKTITRDEKGHIIEIRYQVISSWNH